MATFVFSLLSSVSNTSILRFLLVLIDDDFVNILLLDRMHIPRGSYLSVCSSSYYYFT